MFSKMHVQGKSEDENAGKQNIDLINPFFCPLTAAFKGIIQ